MKLPPDDTIIRIVETVSEASETPIEELPPLANSINVDALASLVTGNPTHDVTIIFSYDDMRVLVHSGNTVYVRPLHKGSEGPLEEAYFEDC